MRKVLGWLYPPKPRALGPIEIGHLQTCVRSAERRQNDCLPWMIQVEFSAVQWITAKRKMPKVLGRLR